MKYSEISHFSHSQHKLKFEYTEVPFKCDGCKEVGIGSRYKCSTCDFDLHMHCALPSPSISHPFYTKCSFQFLSRPPGDKPRFCNACEKDVTALSTIATRVGMISILVVQSFRWCSMMGK
ncbi:hypothetical protein LWI28_025837 [Acer negundo]|uniref:Phorbol-ester/DAG-type domain-containing protein n=1 Tax=Acer negundo TaxID=4023 RepID=A0AAD5J7E4_ACENE|nr:hypothetical protein LWI28_025837 [Acer negundo]